jgi:hypothetical protein
MEPVAVLVAIGAMFLGKTQVVEPAPNPLSLVN